MICFLQIPPASFAIFKQNDNKHLKKHSVTFDKVSGRLHAACKPSQDVSMITVKLVVLQQLHTRARQPPKARPPHNQQQVTYRVTLIEKVPLSSPL